ncbi:glutamate--cysteine ligase, chloroplastic [Tanacetum coccineum]
MTFIHSPLVFKEVFRWFKQSSKAGSCTVGWDCNDCEREEDEEEEELWCTVHIRYDTGSILGDLPGKCPGSKLLLLAFAPDFHQHDWIKKEGKQSISLELGGQFELSGAPLETLHQTCAKLIHIFTRLKLLLRRWELGLLDLGCQTKWERKDNPFNAQGKVAKFCAQRMHEVIAEEWEEAADGFKRKQKREAVMSSSFERADNEAMTEIFFL